MGIAAGGDYLWRGLPLATLAALAALAGTAKELEGEGADFLAVLGLTDDAETDVGEEFFGAVFARFPNDGELIKTACPSLIGQRPNRELTHAGALGRCRDIDLPEAALEFGSGVGLVKVATDEADNIVTVENHAGPRGERINRIFCDLVGSWGDELFLPRKKRQ